MAVINIYCLSGIKSVRKSKGYCIYLLETLYKGEPYTKHWIEEIEETQNGAGIEVARRALKKINTDDELIIYTDSNFFEANASKNIITQKKIVDDRGNVISEEKTTSRMEQWRAEGWINPRTGEKRINWEKWEEVADILRSHPYRISKGTHSYTHWMQTELKRKTLQTA